MNKFITIQNLTKNWVLITAACGMLFIQFLMHRIVERSIYDSLKPSTSISLSIP